MASRANELNLSDPSTAEIWIRTFQAQARTKKLKDDVQAETFEITDLVMASVGIEAIRQVSTMLLPNQIELMPFEQIKQKF